MLLISNSGQPFGYVLHEHSQSSTDSSTGAFDQLSPSHRLVVTERDEPFSSDELPSAQECWPVATPAALQTEEAVLLCPHSKGMLLSFLFPQLSGRLELSHQRD